MDNRAEYKTASNRLFFWCMHSKVFSSRKELIFHGNQSVVSSFCLSWSVRFVLCLFGRRSHCIIPEPDSISVTSVVREPFHPDFEKHCAGLTAGKTPACLKITRVREADGLSWVTQTTVNSLFTEEACRRASTETPSGREHLFHQD